jgi:hypothetical protein
MAQQTIEAAVLIAENCARAKRIAGHLADVPYSQAQLCEVIATLLDQFKVLREEAALANRRYAAANARATKYAKQLGKATDEE